MLPVRNSTVTIFFPPCVYAGAVRFVFPLPERGKRGGGKLLRVCKSFNHFFSSRLSVLTSGRKGRSPLPSRMQQQEQRKNKKEEEIKKRTAFSLTNLKPLLAPSTHISSPLPFLRDLLNFSLLRLRSTPFLLKRLDLEVRGEKGGPTASKRVLPRKEKNRQKDGGNIWRRRSDERDLDGR